jgi:O-antigen ligase
MRDPSSSVGKPTGSSVRTVPSVLVLGLFVVALMGQFTLDRIGVERFGDLDPRLVAFPVLTAAVLLWRFQPDHRDYRHSWPQATSWAIVLIGYLALTAFWALPDARVADSLADLAYLGVLVALAAVVSAPDPARARRLVLVLMFLAALAYAAAGLVIGDTTVQGRTTAFAGGPNVYARVVLLGVVAAAALTVLYRRRWFLLGVPFLAAAALLPASRGAVLAGLLTLLLFGVLTWRRWTARGAGVAVLLVAGTVLVASTLVPAAAATVARTRFIQQLLEERQLSGRPELFAESWAIFLDRPLIGAGLDGFHVLYGDSVDLGYPHNLVLELAVTGGVLAVLLLALFVAALVRDTQLLRPLTTDQLAMLISAGFVGAASLFSGGIYDTRFFWVFVTLAVNYPAVREASQSTVLARRAERRPSRSAVAGVGGPR